MAMNPLYNTALHLYGLGVRVASLRSAKARDMVEGQRATLGRIERWRRDTGHDGFDVWIHAASLGEFEQGRPLIERLRRKRPDTTILLTFFSPSGYRVRQNYEGADLVVYLPFDTPGRARRFLDAANPRMAIFVKYEFWGNYLEQLSRRGVPTYVISAIFRSGQRFFRRGGGMFRRLLGYFTRLYVQDENSRRLLDKIGIDRVSVAGDTRFDRVSDILAKARQVPEAERLTEGSPFTLVVGSSWQPDEEVYIPWLKSHPEVRAIIAPHEFDDQRLNALERKLGEGAVRLSALQSGSVGPAGVRYLIVDCFGLLSSLYRYADVAYVGGGFGAGIHNINEAAVYGIPVLFGPRHAKFKEAGDLIAAGGAVSIADRDSCAAVLDRWLSDRSARAAAGQASASYIAGSVGASDKIYNDLFRNLSKPSEP